MNLFMKNGGRKEIFEAGGLAKFRNPFSPDGVCATLVESVKDGEVKGENVIISSFLTQDATITIKQVIEPDTRIVNLVSIHNVYRYIIECPNKDGVLKNYLLNEVFLEAECQ